MPVFVGRRGSGGDRERGTCCGETKTILEPAYFTVSVIGRTTPNPRLIIIAHGDGTRPLLSGSETLRREAEGGLMREGAGEKEADAARIANDDGAHLEQTAAQNPELSATG